MPCIPNPISNFDRLHRVPSLDILSKTIAYNVLAEYSPPQLNKEACKAYKFIRFAKEMYSIRFTLIVPIARLTVAQCLLWMADTCFAWVCTFQASES